jgi:hypothetical protein
VPKKLQTWQMKTVFDALTQEIHKIVSPMPRRLREAFDSYWPALLHHVRAARNNAGHPSSIDPVTPEAVHASLLLFPELARLGSEVREFVRKNYN